MFLNSHTLIEYLDSFDCPVELERLAEILSSLDIKREHLAEYLHFQADSYTRNLIKRSNWYELLALCWRSGQVSPIHDHFGSSCAFKIVEGNATEINFEGTGPGKARETCETIYSQGEVCVSSSGHIHQVANRQLEDRDLVTLHIYSPPLRMGIYRPDPQYHKPGEIKLGNYYIL